MRFTFVPRSTFSMSLTLAFFFLLIGSYKLVVFTILVLAGWSFILRKKIVFENDDQFTTRGTIYAPISGHVTAVEATETEKIVTIKTNFKDNFGLYLPSTSEVKNLNFETQSSVNWIDETSDLDSSKGVFLELYDKNRQKICLQFIKYYLGHLPELVILPGDRGQRQANIGYFLFGGLTKLYLPQNFNIEVSKGDSVVSTETIIARYNENDKEQK